MLTLSNPEMYLVYSILRSLLCLFELLGRFRRLLHSYKGRISGICRSSGVFFLVL